MASALSPGGYVQQGGSRTGGTTTPRAVNVQVAVRCRPLNARERNSGERAVLQCLEDTREVLCSGVSAAGAKSASSVPAGKKTYTYDHVFGPDSSQQDLYDGVVEPIVEEVLQGYNCTVFAYGQTGTGKTHTMEGRRDDDVLCMAERRLPENAGIIPRSVKQVFDHLRSITDEHSVRVSHLELYNEQLTDLLGPDTVGSGADAGLRVYEDSVKGTFVHGLDEVLVRSEEEIFAVLDKSATKRRTAETLMNKYSSRSHSVFTITIHIKESTPDGADLLKVGKLNLVDLAGSENVGRSGAVRGRAREAGNINQSLLTLGRVITSLVEKHPHVPYRDSKLTRLLQESLGGRNKTCVIATVTPGSSSTEETYSTLDYAHRAKSIKNRPTVNQMIAKHVLLKEYTEEITKIKKELDASRAKNGIYLPPDEYERLQATGRQQKDWILTLESRMEDSENQAAALKGKLTRTQDALARTFADLEKTRETLETTENTLAVRTKEVAVASQQREESNHLVGQHVIGEAHLHADGLALTGTLKQAVSDVDILHTRVDARAAAEKSNLVVVENLRTTVTSQLEAARTDIVGFNKSLVSNLTSCCAQEEDLATGVALHADQAALEIDALCQKMRDLRASHLKILEDAEATASETESNQLHVFKENQALLLHHAREIQSDLDASSENMGAALEAITMGLKNIEANANASLESQLLQMGEFANAQQEFVDRVRSELEDRLAEQKASIMKTDKAVAVAVESQKAAARDAQSKALAQMASVLSVFVAESDASGEATSSVVKSCSSDLQSSVAAVRESVNDVVNDSRSLNLRAVTESQQHLVAAQNRIHTAASQVSVVTSSAVVAGNKSHESLESNLDVVSKSCGAYATNVDAHEAALASERKSRSRRWHGAVQRDEVELATHSSVLVSGIQQNAAETAKASTAVCAGFAAASRCATDFTGKLATVLSSGVISEVDSLRLAVDENAASAPPRRHWSYPTMLHVVPEHETLIDDFRRERGLKHVPLPVGLPARLERSESQLEQTMDDTDCNSSIAAPQSADDNDTQSPDFSDNPANPADAAEPAADGLLDDAPATALTSPLDGGPLDIPAEAEETKAETDAHELMQTTSAALKDRTNLASAKSRRGITKPGNAGVSGSIAKRSGLRPMTRRAAKPAKSSRS